MIDSKKAHKVIQEVSNEGFYEQIKDSFKPEFKDVKQIFLDCNTEYMSEAVFEIYGYANYVKKNISNIPQQVSVFVDHCDMTEELHLNTSYNNLQKSTSQLLNNYHCDYVVEYKARTFGHNSQIEKAIYDLMEYYCNEENEDDSELVNLYALVFYYCKEVSVLYQHTDEENNVHMIAEHPFFVKLEKELFKQITFPVEYTEEQIKQKDFRSPINLFQMFNDKCEFSELDLEYIKKFNLVINFNCFIRDFDILRESMLFYSKEKKAFIHVMKDKQGGFLNSAKERSEDTLYMNLEDVNKLIQEAKQYEHFKLSLISYSRFEVKTDYYYQ